MGSRKKLGLSHEDFIRTSELMQQIRTNRMELSRILWGRLGSGCKSLRALDSAMNSFVVLSSELDSLACSEFRDQDSSFVPTGLFYGSDEERELARQALRKMSPGTDEGGS